jgi:hypothetical protein
MAQVIHEARIRIAWGPRYVGLREPWPVWSTAYSHNPIAYVDLALAAADAVCKEFQLDG